MYIVGLFSGTADFSCGQLASDPFHTISIFIKSCCESATKVHFAIQCSNLHCFLLFQANLPHNRLVILLCFSLLSVFGSNVAKFSGAGALGVLTMSTVAAYGWTNSGKVRAKQKFHYQHQPAASLQSMASACISFRKSLNSYFFQKIPQHTTSGPRSRRQ